VDDQGYERGKGKMILIDGDIITYRCSFKCEGLEIEDLYDTIDEMFDYIFYRCEDLEHKVFLTGKTNFRNDVATIAPYKANRKGKEKPFYLEDAREYLIEEYGATVSDNQEADDDIVTEAHNLDYECIIASTDKDFLQVPCKIFNWGRDTLTEVSPIDAVRFFWSQVIIGDSADNIKGAKGKGEKAVEKYLGGLMDEYDLYEATLRAYEGDLEALTENATLLWLRREADEAWTPPVKKEGEDG